jgi:hypothetical protein
LEKCRIWTARFPAAIALLDPEVFAARAQHSIHDADLETRGPAGAQRRRGRRSEKHAPAQHGRYCNSAVIVTVALISRAPGWIGVVVGAAVATLLMANGARAILFAAEWESEPRRIYQAHVGDPVSRVLGFEGLSLVAVSRSGELAVLRSGGTMNIRGGTLSRVTAESHLGVWLFGGSGGRR